MIVKGRLHSEDRDGTGRANDQFACVIRRRTVNIVSLAHHGTRPPLAHRTIILVNRTLEITICCVSYYYLCGPPCTAGGYTLHTQLTVHSSHRRTGPILLGAEVVLPENLKNEQVLRPYSECVILGAANSKPPPHQLGIWRNVVSSTAGSGTEPQPKLYLVHCILAEKSAIW